MKAPRGYARIAFIPLSTWYEIYKFNLIDTKNPFAGTILSKTEYSLEQEITCYRPTARFLANQTIASCTFADFSREPLPGPIPTPATVVVTGESNHFWRDPEPHFGDIRPYRLQCYDLCMFGALSVVSMPPTYSNSSSNLEFVYKQK